MKYLFYKWLHALLLLTAAALLAPSLHAALPAAVTRQPILFVVRNQYQTDHHNTHTMFPSTAHEMNNGFYEGGNSALKILDPATGSVTTLLNAGAGGVVRDPDVHFSGTRVVFAWRKSLAGTYNIYEINTDGTGLRQLTAHPDVDDIDPIYLADDRIIFVSGREPKYVMCNRHLSHNLYRMDSDGANITQIAKSTLFEGHPSLMADGRILYDRWEYVDRNFGDAQGLWCCDPEGTEHTIYYGNNTSSPGGIIDGRHIPGTQQVVCTLTSCHDKPWGAIAVIDRRRAIDGLGAIVHRWPAFPDSWVRVNNTVNADYDIFIGTSPKYEDPYPLLDPTTGVGGRWFLCSKNIGPGEHMALCLLDAQDGSSIVLHDEGTGDVGCFDPLPLAPIKRPEVVILPRKYDKSPGKFYVVDVYEGTHMGGIERGTVKYLRVVESPEKRFYTPQDWSGQGAEAPGVNWDSFETKRILGTVPVEADGSAYFEAPPDTFLFFQLLDANKMMVHSMRSGTIVQPGETQGCVGCHENRHHAPLPVMTTMPAAFVRPPTLLEGWMEQPPKMFNFLAEVQPVFDTKCLGCHDYGKSGTTKVTLAGDKGLCFNKSYSELWRKGYTGAIGAGPAAIQQAKAWGSHASRLIKTLQSTHTSRVTLTTEEFERIVTWLDLNAVYYPSYASNYPNNAGGRSPLSGAQLGALAGYTGANVGSANAVKAAGELVSFDRPAMSPCLNGVSGTNYDNALAIIQAGQAALVAVPREDMPDALLHDAIDIWRENKYQRSLQREEMNRAAIIAGEKVYDGGLLVGVANGVVSGLSDTSVELTGNLFYTVSNTCAEVVIAWGMWDGGDTTNGWQNLLAIGSIAPGTPIAAVLNDLAPGRPVYYRLFAVNAEGAAPAHATAVFDTLALQGVSAPAQLLTWSSAPTGPVLDGSGNWTLFENNWVDSHGTHLFWNNRLGDTAIFGAGGTPGSVAVEDAGMTVGGLTFNPVASGAYLLAGGALTLTNAPVFVVDAPAVIAAELTGSGGFVKAGAATLTLAGGSSYSGSTQIKAGTLKLSSHTNISEPSALTGVLLTARKLHLDATEAATLFATTNGTGAVAATGDPVGTWGDRSASNLPAKQATAGRRPTYVEAAAEFNGLPVLAFDGSDDDITAPLDINPAQMAAMTIMMVYRQVAKTPNGGLWGHDNGAWDRFQLLNFTAGGQYDGYPISTGGSPLPVSGMNTDAVLIYTAVLRDRVAQGSAVYINGIADETCGLPAFTSTDSGGLASLTLANISPGDGYRGKVRIGEVLVYGMALSESERRSAEAYLREKWLPPEPSNLAAGLPEDAAVAIAAGATLDLGGTTQRVDSVSGCGMVVNGALEVTSTIDPGSESSIGTLTVPNNPNLEGATLRIELAAGSSDCLACSGDLELNGLTLALSNPEMLVGRSGRYRIVTCSGALEGTLIEPELPPRWTVVYQRSSGGGSVSLSKLSAATILILQ